MDGIYFREIFLNLFKILLLLLGITNAILPILQKDISETENENRKKIKVYDIIQLMIILIGILAPFYVIIRYRIKIFLVLMIIVGGIMLGIVFSVALIEFIRYVFLRSMDLKITKESKNTLWLVGVFVLAICSALSEKSTNSFIFQHISGINIFVSDMVKICILILWYFSVIFFILMFAILLLHNIIMIFPRKRKRNNKRKGRYTDWKVTLWSNLVMGSIEKVSKEYKMRKVLYYAIWIICCFVDGIRNCIIGLANLIYMLWTILASLPSILLKKTTQVIGILFQRDQGKVIVICSRLAMVSSLLMIYIINKYEQILSNAGSDIYEFLCSVMIIPFLVTQINSMKNLKKNV